MLRNLIVHSKKSKRVRQAKLSDLSELRRIAAAAASERSLFGRNLPGQHKMASRPPTSSPLAVPVVDDKVVEGFLAQANPDPDPINARAFARSIPHHLLPPQIGEMELTPDLLSQYKGHENLLKLRAMHSPACYKLFDAMRLCILDRLSEDTCKEVARLYQPCDEDLKRQALAKKLAGEEQRRMQMAAKAKVLEGKPASRASE